MTPCLALTESEMQWEYISKTILGGGVMITMEGGITPIGFESCYVWLTNTALIAVQL